MIAPADPRPRNARDGLVKFQADPLDRFDLVVDQDAEPADVDRFLDALDRLVERRISQRHNDTGGPVP